jgi:uncharacterized protein (TIGR03435 family)
MIANLLWRSGVIARCVFALIACILLSGSVLGQSADAGPDKAVALPEFESSTISPHPAGDFVTSVCGPPGRFEAKNVTAKMLVQLAFNLPADQVSGGQPWVATQRFDVMAKISDVQWQDFNKLDDPLRNQFIQQMLQSLLVRHFHLAVSHQQKDLLVFALVTAKSGAKLPVAGTPKSELIESRELVMAMDQNDVPVSALANALSAHFGRTVLDNTGLSGRYDIRLRVEVPDENSPEAVDRAIFGAVEDQLGLKLVTRRRVLDTIVIDHLEQPSTN